MGNIETNKLKQREKENILAQAKLVNAAKEVPANQTNANPKTPKSGVQERSLTLSKKDSTGEGNSANVGTKTSTKQVQAVKTNIDPATLENRLKSNTNDVSLVNKTSSTQVTSETKASTIPAKEVKSKSKNDLVKVDQNEDKINYQGSLNQDIRQFYKFKDVLGGGSFGSVRVAYRRNEEPRKFFAIKSIKKADLSAKDIKNLTTEVQIISKLDHPNIIKFYETYNDNQYFHIVMELCTGKEVFERFEEEGLINESKIGNIIFKLLKAICYCHSVGITHRDLKPENIIFHSKDFDSDIKLIDFGLSKKFNGEERFHTVLGTPYYVAPEVLLADYDSKCDIWSIGAITYTMLNGSPPFTGNSNNIIFEKILKANVTFPDEKWDKISKEAKDFVSKCLEKLPSNRLSAAEALEHPWFKQINDKIHKMDSFEKMMLENLKAYNEPTKFKKLVYQCLIRTVSQTETKKLKIAFNAIDINNEGFICIKDLEEAFKKANITVSSQELEKIIANGGEDRKFDYSEFVLAAVNQKEFLQREKLITAFKYFDIDNSGYICSCDLKNALLRLGNEVIDEEEIEKMISEVQAEKKEISQEEFIKLFM